MRELPKSNCEIALHKQICTQPSLTRMAAVWIFEGCAPLTASLVRLMSAAVTHFVMLISYV